MFSLIVSVVIIALNVSCSTDWLWDFDNCISFIKCDLYGLNELGYDIKLDVYRLYDDKSWIISYDASQYTRIKHQCVSSVYHGCFRNRRLLACCLAAVIDRYLIRQGFRQKVSSKDVSFEWPFKIAFMVTCDVSMPSN